MLAEELDLLGGDVREERDTRRHDRPLRRRWEAVDAGEVPREQLARDRTRAVQRERDRRGCLDELDEAAERATERGVRSHAEAALHGLRERRLVPVPDRPASTVHAPRRRRARVATVPTPTRRVATSTRPVPTTRICTPSLPATTTRVRGRSRRGDRSRVPTPTTAMRARRVRATAATTAVTLARAGALAGSGATSGLVGAARTRCLLGRAATRAPLATLTPGRATASLLAAVHLAGVCTSSSTVELPLHRLPLLAGGIAGARGARNLATATTGCLRLLLRLQTVLPGVHGETGCLALRDARILPTLRILLAARMRRRGRQLRSRRAPLRAGEQRAAVAARLPRNLLACLPRIPVRAQSSRHVLRAARAASWIDEGKGHVLSLSEATDRGRSVASSRVGEHSAMPGDPSS